VYFYPLGLYLQSFRDNFFLLDLSSFNRFFKLCNLIFYL
jgi:hypothetical protein